MVFASMLHSFVVKIWLQDFLQTLLSTSNMQLVSALQVLGEV